MRDTAPTDRLVTRRELADLLGYTLSSLTTLMSRNPDHWPGPVGTGPNRVLLYDPADYQDRLPARVPGSPHLHRPTVSDDRGLLECLLCGTRCRSLARHLTRHGVTTATYRERFHLPATASLSADVTRHADGQRMTQELLTNPDRNQAIHPYQTREHLTDLQRRGVDGIRRTAQYDLVRKAHTTARTSGPAAMRAAKRHVLDTTARDAGYTDLHTAITATAHLTLNTAAARTGLSPQTVRRLRDQYQVHGTKGPPRVTTPDRIALAHTLRDQGLTIAQIARHLGTSWTTTKRMITTRPGTPDTPAWATTRLRDAEELRDAIAEGGRPGRGRPVVHHGSAVLGGLAGPHPVACRGASGRRR